MISSGKMIWLCFVLISLSFVVLGISLMGYEPALYPYADKAPSIPIIIITDLVVACVISSGLYQLYAKIVPYGDRRRGFVIIALVIAGLLYKVTNSFFEILHYTKYFFITNWLGLLFILSGVILFFIFVYLFRRYWWEKYFV